MSSFVKKYQRGKKAGVRLDYAFGITPKKFRREGHEDWRINHNLEVFTNDAIEIYGEVDGEEFGMYIGINKRKHKFDE